MPKTKVNFTEKWYNAWKINRRNSLNVGSKSLRKDMEYTGNSWKQIQDDMCNIVGVEGHRRLQAGVCNEDGEMVNGLQTINFIQGI